jgi:hypothetical protein
LAQPDVISPAAAVGIRATFSYFELLFISHYAELAPEKRPTRKREAAGADR